MSQASNLTNAEDVILAYELMDLGGSPQLVERVTGFTARWARETIGCKHGSQSTYRRKIDPAHWFEKEPDRILHGSYVVKAFWTTDQADHRARRLIHAYKTYRELHFQPILNIGHCADIIDLAECGMAWERTCTSCRQRHLVVAEHPECPVCRRLRAILCRGCGAPLAETTSKARRGRPKQYCEVCETTESKRVRVLESERQRRAHLRKVAG